MKPEINAFIVGAMKSGTTSLSNVLAGHPEICHSRPKESHLFDSPRVQASGVARDDLDKYFAHYAGERILMDATPAYMFLPGCIDAILRHNPNARMIAILRSPVDRAVSQYAHETSRGHEKRPFLLALLLEPWRLRRDAANPLQGRSAFRRGSYVARGRYFAQVRSLLAKSDNVLVIPFRELVRETPRVLDEICRFLDIEPGKLPDVLPKRNAQKLSRSYPFVRQLLRIRLSRDARRTEDLLGWSRGTLM